VSLPPGKLNVKTGHLLDDILIFSVLLAFSRLFFSFFRVFLFFLTGVDIHDIRIH